MADEDSARLKRMKLSSEFVRKDVIRVGSGATPSDGDQVIYHITIRSSVGKIFWTTRSDLGGNGIPDRNVLGRSKSKLLEGIKTMKTGEIAKYTVKAGLLYDEDVGEISKDDVLCVETELISFSEIKVICKDLGVLKKVIAEGHGRELPRKPCVVKAWITAKTGDGKLIQPLSVKNPFSFTIGRSEVPKGLEMGILTMTYGEKALIYVDRTYLNKCSFFPPFEDMEEAHFEVKIVDYSESDNIQPPSPDSDDGDEYRILFYIFKIRPSADVTTIITHLPVWVKYGTILQHYSEVISRATIMVESSILDVLILNLETFQSSQITEMALVIIGNLASHPTLVNEVASETRLIHYVGRALHSSHISCLKQAFRLWSLVLLSTAGDDWAAGIVSKLNMDRISSILSSTIHPEIITMVANCLLRVVTNERDYMLVRSALRTTLPEVLIYWLKLILEGVVPKTDARHATRACVQMFRLLSFLVKGSRDDIAIDELFKMLTSFIKSPNKFEVGEFCFILIREISDMIKCEPQLLWNLSGSEEFLEGVLDLFQVAWNNDANRISLWNMIENLLKHTHNRQLDKALCSRLQCLEEELIVYHVGGINDDEKDIIERVSITIKAYLMDATHGNIDRLLCCVNKYCVGSFDKSRDEHYVKCVTSVVSRGCEDDIQDDVKYIVNIKNERGIGHLEAAIMHMEIAKKLFPHNLETGDRDLEQRMAFDTLIYISSLLFGKASSFLLPWRRVFKLTNIEVEYAFSDSAQRLYGFCLRSVGRDIDVQKLINLREKQKFYELPDQLAEDLFRDHVRKLVEENILAALTAYKSRQMRQSIKEIDKILDFNSQLINFKKDPDTGSFARGLGTISLQDDDKNDDFKLLYTIYASCGHLERHKLSALEQLRDIFGLCKREAAFIIARISSASESTQTKGVELP